MLKYYHCFKSFLSHRYSSICSANSSRRKLTIYDAIWTIKPSVSFEFATEIYAVFLLVIECDGPGWECPMQHHWILGIQQVVSITNNQTEREPSCINTNIWRHIPLTTQRTCKTSAFNPFCLIIKPWCSCLINEESVQLLTSAENAIDVKPSFLASLSRTPDEGKKRQRNPDVTTSITRKNEHCHQVSRHFPLSTQNVVEWWMAHTRW